jgi:hypothetical protein
MAAAAAPPAEAELRAERLGRDLARHQRLQADIAAVEGQLTGLLAATAGQLLTTLPGGDGPDGQLRRPPPAPLTDSPGPSTCMQPPAWPSRLASASLKRRGHSSRQGLPEHRDALMSIAWGRSQSSPSFGERDQRLRGRGMRPIQARVALARMPAGLCYALLRTQQPFDEARHRLARHSRGR